MKGSAYYAAALHPKTRVVVRSGEAEVFPHFRAGMRHARARGMNRRLSAMVLFSVAACTQMPASPVREEDPSSLSSAADDDDDAHVDASVTPSKGGVPADAGAPPVAKKDAGATAQATCCNGKGTCVPSSVVPEESASKLKADTCTASNLCIPTEMIAGGGKAFEPPACEANGLGMKGAGVCLSDCLDMGQAGALLQQGSCEADHKCAPCKLFGQPTGLPGCD
jgi:hypothetical protein